jgi:hypothetical protein
VAGTPDGGSGGALFFVSNDKTGTLTIEHFTAARQAQRRLPDRGLPGHLLPGPRPPGGFVVLPELTRPRLVP